VQDRPFLAGNILAHALPTCVVSLWDRHYILLTHLRIFRFSIWRPKGQSLWAGAAIFGGKYYGACAVHGCDQLIAPPLSRLVDLGAGRQAIEAAKLADPISQNKVDFFKF
jgi:hypothetical protein